MSNKPIIKTRSTIFRGPTPLKSYVADTDDESVTLFMKRTPHLVWAEWQARGYSVEKIAL